MLVVLARRTYTGAATIGVGFLLSRRPYDEISLRKVCGSTVLTILMMPVGNPTILVRTNQNGVLIDSGRGEVRRGPIYSTVY